MPKGLKARVSKLEKRVEREKLIAAKKKEIMQLKAKAIALRKKL